MSETGWLEDVLNRTREEMGKWPEWKRKAMDYEISSNSTLRGSPARAVTGRTQDGTSVESVKGDLSKKNHP